MHLPIFKILPNCLRGHVRSQYSQKFVQVHMVPQPTLGYNKTFTFFNR